MQLQGTVYIDSIFLLNLVMDLYLLTLTNKVLGKTATYTRIFAGSVIGALGYCIVLCLSGISYMLKVLLGMFPIGALMIKISCRTKGIKELMRGEGYLFTFSFLLGGFMIFLKSEISLFHRQSDSIAAVAGMGFAGFVICRKLICVWEKKKQTHFCRVWIPGDTGRVEVMALF